MNLPTTVPVTVTLEAAAHVAELGLEREFEQMLEHLRQTVPDLRSIRVVLDPPYEEDEDPCVMIEATRDVAWGPEDRTRRQFSHWKIETFSPDVWRHFHLRMHWCPHGR